MTQKTFFHLVGLLILFLILNSLVKYVVVPEINHHQAEAQKKYQEDLSLVMAEIPQITEYLYTTYSSQTKQKTLEKKTLLYAVEQQWKEPFLYFLQKKILSTLPSLIKKETAAKEESSFTMPTSLTDQENDNILEFTNQKAYFEDLAKHLSPTQQDTIIQAFQEHLKKLKPIRERMNLEIIQFEKAVPESLSEKENFITDFHYKIGENKEIHLAFIQATIAEPKKNLQVLKGIKSCYSFTVDAPKAISLIPQFTAPTVSWAQAKELFPQEKGYKLTPISETTSLCQIWSKDEKQNITVVEMYWPTLQSQIDESILYDSMLFVFLVLTGIWFYFYHESQSREKESLTTPAQVEQLKKEKQQLETLLINTMEQRYKHINTDTTPINTKETGKGDVKETIKETSKKESYLIPKEQTYTDQKVDLQKPQRDILLEDSKTELLKTLIKRIREN